jgi:hypothetical protein
MIEAFSVFSPNSMPKLVSWVGCNSDVIIFGTLTHGRSKMLLEGFNPSPLRATRLSAHFNAKLYRCLTVLATNSASWTVDSEMAQSEQNSPGLTKIDTRL